MAKQRTRAAEAPAAADKTKSRSLAKNKRGETECATKAAKADLTSARFRLDHDGIARMLHELQQPVEPGCDVFLSHASEDKDAIARPLQVALEAREVTVWFDEIKIKVGQSIRQEIEKGIARCRFGVVVVSPSFFMKQWTQAELDGLFGRKMESGQNLILPVWHHISKDEVIRHSPLLAGIAALNTATMTVKEIADSLADAVRV